MLHATFIEFSVGNYTRLLDGHYHTSGKTQVWALAYDLSRNPTHRYFRRDIFAAWRVILGSPILCGLNTQIE